MCGTLLERILAFTLFMRAFNPGTQRRERGLAGVAQYSASRTGFRGAHGRAAAYAVVSIPLFRPEIP